MLLLLSLGAGGWVLSAPLVRTQERTALEVQVLLMEDGGGRTIGTYPLEIDPSKGGHLDVPIPWPAGGEGKGSLLSVHASGAPGPDEGPHEVELETLLALPSGKSVRAGRSLTLPEGTTSILEAYSEGRLRIVLAVRAERVTRAVVETASGSGPAVRFRLGVERVAGEQAIPLETNTLSSFVGENVEYSFRRGEGDAAESVLLALKVLRIDGNVAEVEAEISASLPGPTGPIVLSRQQKLLTTRGATSSVTVADGTPAAGYRFLITPEF